MYDKVTQPGISPLGVGAANMQGLTLFDDEADYHASPANNEGAALADQGNPHWFLIGMIAILALLWVVRRNSGILGAEALGINLFNLLTITITAIVGIVLFKVIFARIPVPGLTQLVASV